MAQMKIKQVAGEVWTNPHPYELAVLNYLADTPLFPKNWRVEQEEGDSWLVRSAYHLVDGTSGITLESEQLVLVEQGIRRLNSMGWKIAGPLILGLDDNYELFLVDLSALQEGGDNTQEVYDIWDKHGCAWLVKLHQNAKRAAASAGCENWHVYASFNRPVSAMWFKLPGITFILKEAESSREWANGMPHTWVMTQEPLAEEVLTRHELRWGWSP